MKIQDLIFFLIFLLIVWRRSSRWATLIGLGCLILAIPLFKLWLFFSAERLTWSAAAFFAYATVLGIMRAKK